jgi:hypothetical protein
LMHDRGVPDGGGVVATDEEARDNVG